MRFVRGCAAMPARPGRREATYRELIRAAHPDAGGSQAAAAALNASIAEARRHPK